MPLATGSDPDTVRQNIRELRGSGHELNQAIAIALKQARKDHNDDRKKKKDRK
jgi:hypothetical protein